jgi:probable rRNA maturation factor
MVIVKKAVRGVSERALARFAQQARKATGLRGKVNVVLTSSRELRALNRRFGGHDKGTDVLSFPPVAMVAREFAGDIVISAEIAARNARLYQHAPAQELKILILHGMLHLAGFDHERDRGQMARKEERLRRQLGLADGLIRRTAQDKHVAQAPSRVQSRKTADVSNRSRAQMVNGQRPTTKDRRRRQQ